MSAPSNTIVMVMFHRLAKFSAATHQLFARCWSRYSDGHPSLATLYPSTNASHPWYAAGTRRPRWIRSRRRPEVGSACAAGDAAVRAHRCRRNDLVGRSDLAERLIQQSDEFGRCRNRSIDQLPYDGRVDDDSRLRWSWLQIGRWAMRFQEVGLRFGQRLGGRMLGTLCLTEALTEVVELVAKAITLGRRARPWWRARGPVRRTGSRPRQSPSPRLPERRDACAPRGAGLSRRRRLSPVRGR